MLAESQYYHLNIILSIFIHNYIHRFEMINNGHCKNCQFKINVKKM